MVNLNQKNGKYTTYDRFRVDAIEYAGKKIKSVSITNTKTRKSKTFYNDVKDDPGEEKIDKKTANALAETIKKSVFKMNQVYEHFNIKKLEDMTASQYVECIEILKRQKDGNDGKND